ncbi:LCP family protein [Allosalinactinospora lopnorensis]|uniref:LCP family protein n=1 Tax=Allosalinactinospora lopnorensis TaxID=1352348 RepID=UPI000623FCA7|nr:LCP family protein [Allosalinactinospora lopnorensis]
MKDGERDGGNRTGEDAPEFPRFRSEPTPPGPTEPARARGIAGIPSAKVRRQRAVLLFAGMMSCVVLLASGTAWAFTEWASGRIDRFDVFGGLLDGDRPDAGAEGALTFLVIGSDGRGELDEDELGEHEATGERSDSIMLVHLSEERDRADVIGIPRDSWVDVPGHGKNKINAAYSYGGPQLAVQTVESATNVRIDHYVELDFSGFVDVVDALGGVEVCLPEPIDDPKAQLSMDAGTHQVDGKEALAFARTRQTSGGDLDRIGRQQQVLSALLDKALSSETLSDPGRFAAFLDSALGSVTVDEDLDTATINKLGGQVRDLGLDDVSFTQIPVAETDYWTPRGDVAVRWEEKGARRLFADINADRPITEKGRGDRADRAADSNAAGKPRPRDVRLQVFNGVGTPGLGNEVRTALSDAGFAVPAQARNWSSRGVETTLVRHGPGGEDAAALVAESIPGSEPEEDATLGEEIQVVIGSSYTAVAPPEPPPAESSAPRDGAGASTARDNICG